MTELSALSHLALADQHLQKAVRSLNAAALVAPTSEFASHAQAISLRVHTEAVNTYALGCSIGGANLTADLERALGAPAGENCS